MEGLIRRERGLERTTHKYQGNILLLLLLSTVKSYRLSLRSVSARTLLYVAVKLTISFSVSRIFLSGMILF